MSKSDHLSRCFHYHFNTVFFCSWGILTFWIQIITSSVDFAFELELTFRCKSSSSDGLHICSIKSYLKYETDIKSFHSSLKFSRENWDLIPRHQSILRGFHAIKFKISLTKDVHCTELQLSNSDGIPSLWNFGLKGVVSAKNGSKWRGIRFQFPFQLRRAMFNRSYSAH